MQEFISKLLGVTINDGRTLFGTLICTDKDCNFILQDTYEVRQVCGTDTDTGTDRIQKRYIGAVVIPGEQINNIKIIKSDCPA